MENASLNALFRQAQQAPGFNVTYKHRGRGFFVVSGTQGDTIIYQKTVRGSQITATFILTYAKAHSAVFNPIVGDIAKSFVVDPGFMAQ